MNAVRWLLRTLAACDGVFGSTAFPHGDAGGGGGGHAGPVVGTYTQLAVQQDTNAMLTVSDSHYPSDKIHASVKLSDGTIEDVPVADDGSFRFVSPGGTYALTIQTTFAHTTYELTSDQLQLVERVLGFPDRQPVPNGTKISFTVQNFMSDPVMYVATSGQWSILDVTGQTSPFAIDWTNALTASGPPGMFDATHHGSLFWLGYTTTFGTSDAYMVLRHTAGVS